MANKKLFEILKNTLFVFLFLISLSGRSFTGLTILNFRLGELIVGGLLLISFSLFFYKNKKYKKLLQIFWLIIIMYFLSSMVFNEPIFSAYLIKSGSYIWIISLLFVSLVLSKFLKENSWFFIIYLLLPFALYYFETINYPNFLKEFYLSYSDKFDFLKGSDLAIVIISAQILSILKFKKSYHIYVYLLLINSLFLPFLLYKSKGAFLGAFIFFIFLFLKNLVYLISTKKNIATLFMAAFVFAISINHISQLNLYGEDISSSYVEKTASNLGSIVDSKNSNLIFSSFYIQNGRLYSTENNANWRLEIWQDVLFNLIEKEKIIGGYGYSTIIPEMDVAYRQGSDGSNENVHNFIINVLARGGILSLVPYLIFIIYLSFFVRKESKNYLILFYIFSILTISLFDATNESVRYPFIFYTFLGYFLNNLDKTYKFKLTN